MFTLAHYSQPAATTACPSVPSFEPLVPSVALDPSQITSPRPPGHPDSVSPHSASGTVGTTSAEQTPAQCSDQASLHSEPTSEPAVESPARKTVKRAFVQPPHPQQPNPYWQQPPPTLDPVPDLVNPQPKTKADEWHPLLATSQAAGLAFRSEAASSPTRASAAVTDEASKGSDAEEEDPVSLTTRAAVLLSQALFSPLPPHTVPANAARWGLCIISGQARRLPSERPTTIVGAPPPPPCPLPPKGPSWEKTRFTIGKI